MTTTEVIEELRSLKLEEQGTHLAEFIPQVIEKLEQAEEDSFYIECLHSGGVDNWEWYGESLEPFYERYQ